MSSTWAQSNCGQSKGSLQTNLTTPRWSFTILYSNMKSLWHSIKKLLSTHIPSAHTLWVNFQWSTTITRLSWKKTDMQNNLSLGRNCQTHCALEGRALPSSDVTLPCLLTTGWWVHHECQVQWSAEGQVNGWDIKYFLEEPRDRAWMTASCLISHPERQNMFQRKSWSLINLVIILQLTSLRNLEWCDRVPHQLRMVLLYWGQGEAREVLQLVDKRLIQ